MRGGIGDILRSYRRAGNTDRVNKQDASVRREIIWLLDAYTDPNMRMENSGGAIFSMVLTKRESSEIRSLGLRCKFMEERNADWPLSGAALFKAVSVLLASGMR